MTDDSLLIPPTKELTNIEKVKLMNDLANIYQNSDVVQSIKNQPSGDKAFELFGKTIDAEIEKIMTGGKSSVSEKTAAQIDDSIEKISNIVAQLHKLMSMLFQTPVVQTLAEIYRRMGGNPADTVNAVSSLPVNQPAPPSTPPQQNSRAPQQNSDYAPQNITRSSPINSF